MREYLTNHTIEDNGIEAYAENGIINVVDNSTWVEYRDTPDNRAMAIKTVNEIVSEWESNI